MYLTIYIFYRAVFLTQSPSLKVNDPVKRPFLFDMFEEVTQNVHSPNEKLRYNKFYFDGWSMKKKRIRGEMSVVSVSMSRVYNVCINKNKLSAYLLGTTSEIKKRFDL